MKEKVARLWELSRSLKILEDIRGLLDWDMQTCMPSKGGGARAEHQALVQSLIHEKASSPAMRDALRPFAAAGTVERLGATERALVREMRRRYFRERRVPADLVEEMARLDAVAYQKWTAARAASSFKAFEPYLAKQVELKRRLVEHLGYRESPYDAVLDLFEPGATTAWVEGIFAPLKEGLIGLVAKLASAKHPPSLAPLEGAFDLEKQWKFGIGILERMGFDFEAGRQDKSVHPFTASCGGVGDVRITTRLNPNDLRPGLFGTIHEGGHALYEQGFGKAVQNSLLGVGVSCAIHESQSRLWENLVGRSRPFWRYWYPRLKRVFPHVLRGTRLSEFYRSINRVAPSFIRVEADEVTYGLHIILRFEIEKDLLEGRLEVKDVPARWNAKMQAYLGVRPPNNRLGALQDVHWSCGAFGYFPSYALGNLYAAQFFRSLSKEKPDLEKRISAGDLSPLLDWLRKRIHRHGRIYIAEDLVRRVTGKPLGTDSFLEYLSEKYGVIYG